MPGKIRVSALAKELGISNKEAIAKLGEIGEYVKSASSTVEPPVARKLHEAFPDAKPAPAKKAPAKKAASKLNPAKANPHESQAALKDGEAQRPADSAAGTEAPESPPEGRP